MHMFGFKDLIGSLIFFLTSYIKVRSSFLFYLFLIWTVFTLFISRHFLPTSLMQLYLCKVHRNNLLFTSKYSYVRYTKVKTSHTKKKISSGFVHFNLLYRNLDGPYIILTFSSYSFHLRFKSSHQYNHPFFYFPIPFPCVFQRFHPFRRIK